MSLAARIISTTMPDGSSALPAFICEIANNGDWDGRSFHWWMIRQTVWVPVKFNVEKPLVVVFGLTDYQFCECFPLMTSLD